MDAMPQKPDIPPPPPPPAPKVLPRIGTEQIVEGKYGRRSFGSNSTGWKDVIVNKYSKLPEYFGPDEIIERHPTTHQALRVKNTKTGETQELTYYNGQITHVGNKRVEGDWGAFLNKPMQ